MRFFLIGMPGSGKSTIGRHLAEILGLPVVDLDKLIEEEAGQAIPDIFNEWGEDHFRNLEREALKRLITQSTEAIVSTGGGAPCFFDNFAEMKKAGKTIYIDVPLPTLIERTAKSSKRPLLIDDPVGKITALLNKREAIYKQADLIFSTQGRASDQVAGELAQLLA